LGRLPSADRADAPCN